MTELENKEKLFEVLRSGTPEEKSEVLEQILETSDISIIVPLVKVLEKEKVRAVKERILLVLNHLVPISDFKDVESMLRSPDPFVRNGIVEIIKKEQLPVIKFLKQLSEDEDKDVRKFVIDALSKEKSEEVLEIIRKRLDDPEINIVYTAIEYLGELKDVSSVEKIEEILFRSDNLMVICASLEALSKIKVSPGKEKIVDKYLKENNPMLIFPFLKYLGAFGNKESLQYVEGIIDFNPQMFTKEVIDATEGIMLANNIEELPESLKLKLELMVDNITNDVNKYEIIKILTKSGGANSLEKAREMLENENDMIKLCAVEILGDIGDESDIVKLEEIAEVTESDELLEAIGDAVMNIDERISS